MKVKLFEGWNLEEVEGKVNYWVYQMEKVGIDVVDIKTVFGQKEKTNNELSEKVIITLIYK